MKSIAQENAELIKREAKYVLKLNELIEHFETLFKASIEDLDEASCFESKLMAETETDSIKYTLYKLKTLRNE